MTRGEGWNVDELVNRKLHPAALLPLHYDGPPAVLLRAAPIYLFVSHSILHSLMNKTSRYLNSFTWGRSSR